jgi:hypothetical protein
MSKVSKKYQLKWEPKTTIEALNKELSTLVARIEEQFQAIYANAIQAEDGTWTPTDLSGGNLTFADPTGTYVKLGPIVIANAYLKWPTTASTNGVQIGGLPFPVISTSIIRTVGAIVSDETTAIHMFVNSSGNLVPLTSAAAIVTNATMSTNYLYFTIIYRTTE